MKILTILTNGFEELEAIGTIALLKRSGIDVDIRAIKDVKATGRFELTLSDLHPLNDIGVNRYDALFIPGGPHFKTLEANDEVKEVIHSFVKEGKILCAICAAPTILGHMGLLKNKNYTCFTSMNEDFGGTYIDQYVVVDHTLITGRSAAASIDFGFTIIEKLQGKEQADKIKKEIYY